MAGKMNKKIDYAGKIREIRTFWGLSAEQVDSAIGKSTGRMRAVEQGRSRIKGRVPPTELELEKFCSAIPVQKRWLLIGQGPMLQDRDERTQWDRVMELCTRDNIKLSTLAERIGSSPSPCPAWRRRTACLHIQPPGSATTSGSAQNT